MRKSSFEPLTGVLEPWFESDELPDTVMERIRQGFPPGEDSPRNRGPMLLARMWNTFGPGQRREAARQWDYNNDPTNEAEQNRMFELQSLQFDLENRITKIEIGPVRDAAARDIHLQGLKKELADVGYSILQLTTEEPDWRPVGTAVEGEPIAAPALAATHEQGASSSSGGSNLVTLPRPGPGRPNTRETSIRLFKERRKNDIPRAKTQLAEAEAIVAIWPCDGPRKPLAPTVSGHISDLWKRPDKSPDKR